MTKPLDPEIKALRAMSRAWASVPDEARQRCLEWFVARVLNRPGHRLPQLPAPVAANGEET